MHDGSTVHRLAGWRVLVVEDDYFLAEDLCRSLEACGAVPFGPMPDVASALDLLAREPLPDAACLDVNLGEDLVYPVADALTAQGVPFCFATARTSQDLPVRYAGTRLCSKPVDMRALGRCFPVAGQ